MAPFWRNTAISALIHAAIIVGLLVVSVVSFQRRKPTFPNPIMINLVDAPPDAGQTVAPPPQKPPPPPVPLPPKQPPKPPPKKTPPKPPPKKTPPPKQPQKPKITQRELERLLHDAIATSDSPARQPAPTDDFQWYYTLVYQALYDAWQQPGMLSRSAGLATTVVIRVQRDGAITSRTMLRSSGNAIMDQSVMDAVRSVNRLRPLPAAWGGLYKDISVDFLLTDTSL